MPEAPSVSTSSASGAAPRAARPADTDPIPRSLRIAAGWTWRLLVLAAGIVVLAELVSRFSSLLIPVAIALLFTALAMPTTDRLDRFGVPRGLATGAVLIGGIVVVGAVLTFVVQQFVAGVPDLADQTTESLRQLRDGLANSPLHLDQQRLDSMVEQATTTVREHQSQLTSGAISAATGVTEFLVGALLTLFVTIFFLYGGGSIWEFLTRLVPPPARAKVRNAGRLGFLSLVSYVRATVLVALVDAIGIGVGLWILHVPLALPLASLVFLAAFVPIVGSVVAGTVAIAVAFVAQGPVSALIILGVVIGVMQLESHVLQPLLLGRAVNLHPLAVVLAIAAGITLAGITGGLLAVPLVAVLNTMVRTLLHPRGAVAGIEDVLGPGDGPSYHADPDDPEAAETAETAGDPPPNAAEEPDGAGKADGA